MDSRTISAIRETLDFYKEFIEMERRDNMTNFERGYLFGLEKVVESVEEIIGGKEHGQVRKRSIV